MKTERTTVSAPLTIFIEQPGLAPSRIRIDGGKNNGVQGEIAEIQKDRGGIKVLAVKTDEEREIAHQTVDVVTRS